MKRLLIIVLCLASVVTSQAQLSHRFLVTNKSEPSFDPASLSWLVYVNSGSVNKSGSNITQFNDLSGSGNNFAQATSGNQAIDNSGTSEFDGTDDFYEVAHNTAFNPSGDCTVIIAGELFEPTPQNSTIISKGSINTGWMFEYVQSRLQVYRNNNATDPGTSKPWPQNFDKSLPGCFAFVVNGSDISFYYDGQIATVPFAGTWPGTNTSNLRIGATNSGTLWPSTAKMKNILFKNSFTNKFFIEKTFNFFYSKYGFAFKRNIVCDGNSITFGLRSTGGNTYPNQLQTLLGTTGYLVQNYGVVGQTWTDMLSDVQTEIDATHYNIYTQQSIVVAWEGTNQASTGATDVDIYNYTRAYCAARKSAGFKVIVMTTAGSSNFTSLFRAKIVSANAMIRANWTDFADGFVDVGADARFDEAATSVNLTYYDADGTHLNDTGYGVIAGLVNTVILTL